jgi:hypothetical protein
LESQMLLRKARRLAGTPDVCAEYLLRFHTLTGWRLGPSAPPGMRVILSLSGAPARLGSLKYRMFSGG